jgi:hypothetical protein
MRPAPCTNRLPVLALVMFGLAGSKATATADPMEPSKVATVKIRPPSAGDHRDQLASPANSSPRLQTLRVRSPFPGEQRDPSGREYSAEPDPGNAESSADLKTIRTVPVREPSATAAAASDHHTIHTIRVPSQSAPQQKADGYSLTKNKGWIIPPAGAE